jgi:hypothetical protein
MYAPSAYYDTVWGGVPKSPHIYREVQEIGYAIQLEITAYMRF